MMKEEFAIKLDILFIGKISGSKKGGKNDEEKKNKYDRGYDS